jgi:signal transduction histidine kinase
MEKGAVDMAIMVREVCEELTLEKQAAPQIVLQPLEGARGDRAMLRQVLVNLIGNAVKFSSHQPEPVVEIGSRQEPGHVVFYVKDNGVGFDDRFKDKLFGVFQRLHSEEEFEGNGVGLALVQQIVRRHGGRVWAESKVGQGATFYFALPKEDE